jgi:hypothetical protein
MTSSETNAETFGDLDLTHAALNRSVRGYY